MTGRTGVVSTGSWRPSEHWETCDRSRRVRGPRGKRARRRQTCRHLDCPGDRRRSNQPRKNRRVQMSDRFLAVMLTVIAVAFLVPPPLSAAGQGQTAAAQKWTPPRTPDGRPDLQGVWTMATFTPLERPKNIAGKEFYTEQEEAELTQLLSTKGIDPLARTLLAA